MYLSHEGFEGVSSPTQHRLSSFQTAPLLHLLDNSQHPNQMDYFDDYGNFYPNPSAREELDAYQFPDQTPVTEGVNYDAPYSTFTDTRGIPEQPGTIASSSTSPPATDSYGTHYCNLFADRCLTLESPEPLAPYTSHTSQTDGYVQPSYTGNYRPEVGQQAQPSHSGSSSHDYSFGGAMLPQPSTVDPTPGSCKSLSSLKLRVLEYLPTANSHAQQPGGKPERILYWHIRYGKHWSSFILV